MWLSRGFFIEDHIEFNADFKIKKHLGYRPLRPEEKEKVEEYIKVVKKVCDRFCNAIEQQFLNEKEV